MDLKNGKKTCGFCFWVVIKCQKKKIKICLTLVQYIYLYRFGGHNGLCSELTRGSAHLDHCWWSWGDHMRCRGWGQPSARRVLRFWPWLSCISQFQSSFLSHLPSCHWVLIPTHRDDGSHFTNLLPHKLSLLTGWTGPAIKEILTADPTGMGWVSREYGKRVSAMNDVMRKDDVQNSDSKWRHENRWRSEQWQQKEFWCHCPLWNTLGAFWQQCSQSCFPTLTDLPWALKKYMMAGDVARMTERGKGWRCSEQRGYVWGPGLEPSLHWVWVR